MASQMIVAGSKGLSPARNTPSRKSAAFRRETGHAVKVIVETTAYAKALVKLEEKSPDTNYWNTAGTFVININGVRSYTLSPTRRIAIEEIPVTTTVVSADE